MASKTVWGKSLNLVIQLVIALGLIMAASNRVSAQTRPTGKIAFYACKFECGEGAGRLYVIDADGSNLKVLVAEPRAIGPQWLPDGIQIVFTYFPTADFEKGQIYSINADGSNLRRFISTPIDTLLFSWSPDGKYLIFRMGQLATLGPSEAFIMRSDGSGLRNLGESPSSFAWSADSTQLTISVSNGQARDLYVMTPDNRQKRLLFAGGATNFNSSWSPDGRQIVFERRLPQKSQIYRIDVTGENLENLSNSDSDDKWPRWSSDGRFIAFARDLHLWIMHPDGSSPMQIGGSKDLLYVEPGNYAWSPDGRWIVFGARPEYKQADLYLVDTACADSVAGCERAAVNLTQDRLKDDDYPTLPVWSPVGQK